MGHIQPQGRVGRPAPGCREPARRIEARDRFQETTTTTLHPWFSAALDYALIMSGPLGRPCLSGAVCDRQEMAHCCFQMLLAMEVMQERWAISDFEGIAEPDLPDE